MKNQVLTKVNYLFIGLMLFLASPLAFAQEKDININVNNGEESIPEDWMSNPLYWVIGGLVLLLIIAIIARGSRK
ncbi:hypothetical protein NLM59_05615 [Weeksellaceae bacterium KMM 9724]|uniref:hypothetical protein n=1 Tax=Profundicola chukchiensis TaxID=2961959 RepID=UPI002437BE98|nr:hypothetical protein [Profundicola chukchiensis]MDG4950391.1 hypothetical protein [Profundicola chukchiensis]